MRYHVHLLETESADGDGEEDDTDDTEADESTAPAPPAEADGSVRRKGHSKEATNVSSATSTTRGYAVTHNVSASTVAGIVYAVTGPVTNNGTGVAQAWQERGTAAVGDNENGGVGVPLGARVASHLFNGDSCWRRDSVTRISGIACRRRLPSFLENGRHAGKGGDVSAE